MSLQVSTLVYGLQRKPYYFAELSLKTCTSTCGGGINPKGVKLICVFTGLGFNMKKWADIYTENIYYSSWRNSDVRAVLVVDGLIWAQRKKPVYSQHHLFNFTVHSLMTAGVKAKHLYKYFEGWEEYST